MVVYSLLCFLTSRCEHPCFDFLVHAVAHELTMALSAWTTACNESSRSDFSCSCQESLCDLEDPCLNALDVSAELAPAQTWVDEGDDGVVYVLGKFTDKEHFEEF